MTGIKICIGDANRIIMSFLYNPDYIVKIKTKEGYKWHPEEKYWSLPSGNDILEGTSLDIDPSLQTIVDGVDSKNFEDLRRELISRKYSPKTIKNYIHYNENLLRLATKSTADVVNAPSEDS